MSYATVADVQNEYKGSMTFTSTSAVTTSQVQGFLDQATAYINGKVGMRYVLPISGTDAQELLRTICLFIVVQRLKPVLKIDTGAAKGSQTPASDDLIKQADKMLDDIVSGKTDLTVLGAVLKSQADGIDSHNARSGVTGLFRRGTRQW